MRLATDGRPSKLWGGETDKAVANFPVSGEPIPAAVAHWLGRIKAAAARANADLGLLDSEMAGRIAAAGDRVAAGEFDDQFPIDVFQTGSGTSSNMNANEVITALAGDRRAPERPRQHGPVVERRLPVGGPSRSARHGRERPAARDGDAGPLARVEGRRVRRRDQVGPDAPDGCRPRHARPGVRGLRRAGAPGDRPRAGRASAARPDPARRHRRRDRHEHPSGLRRQGAGSAARGDQPADLGAGRSVRVAGGAGRPRRALGRAEGHCRRATRRSPTTCG